MLYVKRNNRTSTGRKSTRSLLLVTALVTVLLGCTLFVSGCGGGANGSNSKDAAASSGNDMAASASASPSSNSESQAGLPKSFTAYGNSYSITSYSIEVNDEGNTIVTCEGSGFDILPLREGSFRMPLECTLISGGTSYDWTGGMSSSGSLEFEFEGIIEPDTVIFTAGDDEAQRVELTVK